jgi:hypothetical protein
MIMPNDPVQLVHVAAGGSPPFTRGGDFHLSWLETLGKAGFAGHVAGSVLALLYALERAGWPRPPDPAPSLSVSIHCAAAAGMDMNRTLATPDGKAEVQRAATLKLATLYGRESPPGIVSRAARGKPPRFPGKSTVDACWRRMRSVAHLWAAYALYKWELMGSHGGIHWLDVVRTDEGVRALLATARAVQLFAQGWCAPGTEAPAELLGPSPWLVPEGFHRAPVWPRAIPHWTDPYWLDKALSSYKRPPRMKGEGAEP